MNTVDTEFQTDEYGNLYGYHPAVTLEDAGNDEYDIVPDGDVVRLPEN
jgi:hypothetical protein